MGGAKKGVISFLGETQFAPGEWAGVTLDEPQGKNDGSVGGVEYFKVSYLFPRAAQQASSEFYQFNSCSTV